MIWKKCFRGISLYASDTIPFSWIFLKWSNLDEISIRKKFSILNNTCSFEFFDMWPPVTSYGTIFLTFEWIVNEIWLGKCTFFIQLPLNPHIPLTFFHQPPMFHDQCGGINIFKTHSWTLWISEKAENKEKLDFQKSSKMAIYGVWLWLRFLARGKQFRNESKNQVRHSNGHAKKFVR